MSFRYVVKHMPRSLKNACEKVIIKTAMICAIKIDHADLSPFPNNSWAIDALLRIPN